MTLTKAIAVAGKMWNSRKYTSQGLNVYFSYKDYNTPAKLSELDEVVIQFHLDLYFTLPRFLKVKLLAAGIDEKDSRKLIITALRKAGYGVKSTRSDRSQAGPSTQRMTAVEVLV